MTDELRQLFRYEGAVDDREGIREIASEVLLTSFWTAEFCATVIRAAEAVGVFEPHDDDPVPGHEVSLAVISPMLFNAVEQDLGMRIWPRLRQFWPYVDYHGLRDAFVIRYALGEQEELRIHHDVAQVSASVKLNDGYEGAELDFPRQHVTNATAAVGEMLVWPSLVTHPHRTNLLRSGVKYALTVWFEVPTFGE
ncbi:MAG: hypothetical protein ABIQ39_10630 [Ilumatobacteraceae bacterium]